MKRIGIADLAAKNAKGTKINRISPTKALRRKSDETTVLSNESEESKKILHAVAMTINPNLAA